MALPVFRAAGAKTTGTTSATTVSAPAGVATGDLEILIVTTIAGGSVTINDNGGSSWTACTVSPVDVASGEKLYVWWRVRQSGDGDPQVSAGSDHFCAGRLAYQTGTFDVTAPLEIQASGTETTSDTSFSWAPGTSTTDTDRLVLCIATSGYDSNTGQVPVMSNANLSSLYSRANYNTNTGGGGGFGVTEGARAAAGAVGTFACTYSQSSPKAYISFAIKRVGTINRTIDLDTPNVIASATAGAVAPTPKLIVDPTPAAEATAAGLVPTAEIRVSVPAAIAYAAMSVRILAPAAEAVASIVSPSLVSSSTVSAPAAGASATAPAPVPKLVIVSSVAQATASSVEPVVAAGEVKTNQVPEAAAATAQA